MLKAGIETCVSEISAQVQGGMSDEVRTHSDMGGEDPIGMSGNLSFAFDNAKHSHVLILNFVQTSSNFPIYS